MLKRNENPIFIIGAGRSGTSILYNLMAVHPELCWFSNYSTRFVKFPFCISMNRLKNFPLLGALINKKILENTSHKRSLLPTPSEGGGIYHSYCGFRHDIKSTEKDFSDEAADKLKHIIRNHLFYTRKKRFVTKQTANNQRIRLIHKIFPDAYYIHLIRDGRAVTSSLLNVGWLSETKIWWKEKGFRVNLDENNVELCASHWKTDTRELLNVKEDMGDHYLEIRYEDLVEKPRKMMRNISKFCNLSWDLDYENLIPEKLPNMNNKWRTSLDGESQVIMKETLNGILSELGYC